MFCTCSRSSAHKPPGRHSSRRLQLVQLTLSGSGLLTNCARGLGLSWMTACMGISLLNDHVSHAFELARLVKEAAGAEALGDLAVWIGRMVAEHRHVDLGRLRMQGAQHVEAAALL